MIEFFGFLLALPFVAGLVYWSQVSIIRKLKRRVWELEAELKELKEES